MYIKGTCYGGMDWHDSKLIITQLKWDGKYDIPESKVTDCIVNDILQQFPYLDPMDIYFSVLNDRPYKFPLLYQKDDEVVYPEEYEGTWISVGEIKGFSVKETYIGGCNYSTHYSAEAISEEQLCYIAEEHFYAYSKGVPLVERFYHAPFRRLDEAEAHLKTMKKHAPDAELSIQIYNLEEISATDWFQSNMKAVELSSGDPEKGYAIVVDLHIENLKKLVSSDPEVRV